VGPVVVRRRARRIGRTVGDLGHVTPRKGSEEAMKRP
jgi:hypothetical protein